LRRNNTIGKGQREGGIALEENGIEEKGGEIDLSALE